MMEAMAWVMKEKRKAKYVAGHEVTLLSNQSALPSKAISRPKLWFFSCGCHLDFLLHPSHMSH